jgi:1-acyl-sn-glycerol-3-phosphate acyltransferase
MSSLSDPIGRPSPRPIEVLDRLVRLTGSGASDSLRTRLATVLHDLDAREVEEVHRALEEVHDLEDRTVRNVLGRDGNEVAVHHYRACRAEDAEASWAFRPPSAPIRALRDSLLSSLLDGSDPTCDGVQGVAEAADAGRRFLFISNHESVFDLAILPHALRTAGLKALSERLTFFVNPKIFNTPFINFFICKPLGLLKVPQNPRIAANESVMEPGEIQRRADAGFRAAGERLAAGDSLVIYPEGLRSEGVLHRFARAYLDLLRPESLRSSGLAPDDVLLVPWAHRGVRALEELTPSTPDVSVSFGEPLAPERFFDTLGGTAPGVAAHLAGFLVARLLPDGQRGLYGADAAAYLEHPHYRQRIREHTLADIRTARDLSKTL